MAQVSEHYEHSPASRRAAAEALSAALGGMPVVLMARPGMHGSSGDHARDRHTEEEVALIDAALTQLRQRHGLGPLTIHGFSSGGAILANLLARRDDIRCAVITSAPLDLAQFYRRRDGTLPVTPAGITLILSALDRIKEIVAGIEATGGESPGEDGPLIAALNAARPFGRFALCGAISMYNATELPPGPPNLMLMVGKQLRMEGFIVSSSWDMMPAFLRDLSGWVKEGKVTWKETVFEGIEKAPDAFLGLFKGENLGKMLVKLG